MDDGIATRYLPKLTRGALKVAGRNLRVWWKLIIAGVLMHILEPLLYLVALGYGLGFFIREMSGMSYLSFLASGIMVSSAMMTASFESMFSAFSRLDQQRTYDSLLATPLTVDDITFGEILWSALKAAMSGVGILVVALLLGVIEGWLSLLAIPIVFLTGAIFSAMALSMTALAKRWDFFQYYMTLLLTPMMLISGVFYPVSSLPAWMQMAVQCLPLVHAIDLIRPLMTGQPLDAVGLHLMVLVSYLVIFSILSAWLMRRRLFV